MKFIFDRVENIVGQEANVTAYQYFLIFPQRFQKDILQGLLKDGNVQ